MSTVKRATSRSELSKANSSQSSSRRAKIRKPVKTYSISSLPGVWDDEPEGDIRSATLDEIEEMARRGELAPTRPDAEEIELDNSFWAHARLMPALFPRKASVHLRLDQNVLDWFKAQGKGHLTRMNAVLRTYVHAQMSKSRPSRSFKPKRKKLSKRAAASVRQHKKTSRS